jgi:CDP-diacylglycerol--glycerol-3-phosphate 3-phosphatidyltransferase
VLKAKIGQGIDPAVRKLLPFLFRRSIDPNLLTVIGTVICLASAVAFAFEPFWGAVILCLGGLFDLVDGVVARHHGTESNFGAWLDSTLDRLVDMAVLLGLLMFYARAGESSLVLLVGWALVASVMVSYSKARAERFVEHFEGGIMERAERMGLLALGALTGFLQTMLWIVAIGSTITVIQRFGLAYRAMNALEGAEMPKSTGAEHPSTSIP